MYGRGVALAGEQQARHPLYWSSASARLVLVPPLELERWGATHARYLVEPAA